MISSSEVNMAGREQFYGLLDACMQAQTILYDKIPKTPRNWWLIHRPNKYLPLKQGKLFKHHMSLYDLMWENIKGYLKVSGERIEEMIKEIEKEKK